MKRPELIAAFRSLVDDEAQPYLWSDAEAQRYLDAAHREAADRARMIRDASTSAVCSVSVTAGIGSYALHASILDVTRAKLSTARVPLTVLSVDAMDMEYPGWETATGNPQYLVLDAQGAGFAARLVPTPTQAATLSLVVHRLPLASIASDDDEPEIPERWHLDLIDWMAHLAYSKQDAETQNDDKATLFETRFARVFGERLDANVQRKHAARNRAQVAFREF